MSGINKLPTIVAAKILLTVLVLVLAGCSASDDTGKDNEIASTPSTEAMNQNSTASSPPTVDRPKPQGNTPTEEPAPDSSFDSDGDGWMTWEEVEAAVRTTFPNYAWPSNYTTDVDTLLTWREGITNANGKDVSETNFQSGIEYSLPGEANLCSWTYNWLDAYGESNQAKMEESMTQMEAHVAELWSLSGIRQDLEADINRAKLGDISGLQRFSVMFCDKSIFLRSIDYHTDYWRFGVLDFSFKGGFLRDTFR